MEKFAILLLVGGGLLLALDLYSEAIRRLWLSVPLLALCAGVLLGPHVLGVVVPEELGAPRPILEGIAQVVIALTVVDVGLRMGREQLTSVWGSAARLLLVGMPLMWALTGLLAWALLGVPFWVAFLIGAILTPTDPVVASAISAEALARAHLPVRLRRLLELESGANDGLAVALFLLPALVLDEPGGALASWAGHAAEEIGIGAGLGIATGFVVARATNRALQHKDVQRPLLLGVTVGIALTMLAGGNLLGGSGVLAAFAAGLTFALTVDDEARERLEDLHSTAANLLVAPTFAYFGAVLPFAGWAALGVPGVVFAVAVLVVRRPPAVAVALARSAVPRRDRLFLAWFGPIGVAAMYYAVLIDEYRIPHHDTVFAAATLTIVASIVAHSMTATPSVLRFGGEPVTFTLRHPAASTDSDDPARAPSAAQVDR